MVFKGDSFLKNYVFYIEVFCSLQNDPILILLLVIKNENHSKFSYLYLFYNREYAKCPAQKKCLTQKFSEILVKFRVGIFL